MRPRYFDIEELVTELRGTCNSLYHALPDGMEKDDLTDEDKDFIYNKIFLCEQCKWWCDVSERKKGFCNDCNDAIEEI